MMTPRAIASEISRKEWRHARQRGLIVCPIEGAADAELDFATLPNWTRTGSAWVAPSCYSPSVKNLIVSERMSGSSCVALVLACNVLAAARGADWPAWRGPAGTGVSTETNLPIHWSDTENVRWKTPLPERGNSTPIVWGDRVFVTQALEKEDHRQLFCFNRATGREVWHRGTLHADEELTHETNPFCSASPVTDGERVIASFGSAGLFCYDFNDGRELWQRDLGPQRHIWGNGASPILFGDLCILNFGPGERTFLIAVDKRTGRTVWQVEEPGGSSGEKPPGVANALWIGSWSTPVVIGFEGRDELLMTFPNRVAAFDPLNGKPLWTCLGLNALVYTSPLYADGVVVAMGGYMGSSLAVEPGGGGDVTDTHRLWHTPKTRQRIGSGVVSGGHIYILNDPGIAECLELRTGRVVWAERLKGPGAKSDSWSSMVLSEDRIFAINQSGDTFVLKANPEFEVLATNSIREATLASLAVSRGDIFIRTHERLWCIGKN